MARQGQHFVVPLGEAAVEPRIAKVRAKASSSNLIPREPLHPVQSSFRVPCPITLPQCCVQKEVTNRFDPRPNTKPLIQQFVDESGAHKLCSSGGHVPEVVVVQVERDSPGRLVVDAEIAAADARARWRAVRQTAFWRV